MERVALRSPVTRQGEGTGRSDRFRHVTARAFLAWDSPPWLLHGDSDAEAVGGAAGEPAMGEAGDYSELVDFEQVMLEVEQEAQMK